MAIITPEHLLALAPTTRRAAEYAPALDAVLERAGITTPLRVAHFMAQLCHESGGFRALVENLNYRPETLMAVFKTRVPTLEQATALVNAGKDAIAEHIYGGRLGNVNPGDGARFIGRGFIMVTGRTNYELCGTRIGQPLTERPELLEQPAIAALASAAFWQMNNLNAAADLDDVNRVTRLINGGDNGLADRKILTDKAKRIWLPAPVALPPSQPVTPQPSPATPIALPAGALSRYFTLEEMTFSSTAVRQNIDNTPPAAILEKLRETATQMDAVRELLAQPITVTSGYRSPALNAVINGSPTSAHMSGKAVDFVSRKFGSPLDICRQIAGSDIQFDQLIQEGTWVHISFDPRMRREVKTANFSGGAATYSSGL
jgi:putative chitinase